MFGYCNRYRTVLHQPIPFILGAECGVRGYGYSPPPLREGQSVRNHSVPRNRPAPPHLPLPGPLTFQPGTISAGGPRRQVDRVCPQKDDHTSSDCGVRLSLSECYAPPQCPTAAPVLPTGDCHPRGRAPKTPRTAPRRCRARVGGIGSLLPSRGPDQPPKGSLGLQRRILQLIAMGQASAGMRRRFSTSSERGRLSRNTTRPAHAHLT